MKIDAVPVDLRVALLYALFGGLWIAFSDRLLAAIVNDISTFTTLQTYKGWFFVVVSAVLIFILLRREQSLRRISDAGFQQTLDNMLEGCQIIGFDWRYLYLNDTAVRQSGQARQALLGHTMLESYPGLENTQFYSVLRRCMEERRSHRMENDFRYPDGRVGWFDLSIQPAPEGLFILSIDITSRRQAEQEVRLHRDRLAALSRQLTQAYESQSRLIGRELHDQIGQMLTGLKLTIEIALQLPAETAAKKLAAAQEIIDDIMTRVSNLSLELRPPMLDDLGLVPALLWRVSRYQARTGIQVDFRHNGVEGRRFIPELETTAFRVIQEAMTNAARHAKATHVELEVRAQEGRLEIRIRDNGRGFDPQAGFDQNRGLSGMRERARLLNGSLNVVSEAGRGSLVSIVLPFQEKDP